MKPKFGVDIKRNIVIIKFSVQKCTSIIKIIDTHFKNTQINSENMS